MSFSILCFHQYIFPDFKAHFAMVLQPGEIVTWKWVCETSIKNHLLEYRSGFHLAVKYVCYQNSNTWKGFVKKLHKQVSSKLSFWSAQGWCLNGHLCSALEWSSWCLSQLSFQGCPYLCMEGRVFQWLLPWMFHLHLHSWLDFTWEKKMLQRQVRSLVSWPGHDQKQCYLSGITDLMSPVR